MSRENFIVVDIGSSRVVGALIEKEADKPKIVYASYKEIPFKETVEPARYQSLVVSVLRDCLNDLTHHLNGVKPRRALCTLSSIMCDVSLATRMEKYQSETLITKKIIESNDNEQTSIDKTKKILDHALIQIKLNGYPTTNPVGKTAHSLEMTIYTSTVDTELIKQLTDEIGKGFHGIDILSHSTSFVIFTVLRNMIHDDNFVCVDFGGEITDIIISKRGVLEKTISIPFGKNMILREIIKTMNVSLEIAESSLHLYHTNKLSSEFIDPLKQVLDACNQRWNTLFLGALEHVTLDSLLPQDVYLLAHPSVAPIISNYLESGKYDRYVFVGQKFRVHEIADKTLRSFCDSKDQSAFIDPTVVISALFSDTLHKEQ
ncbi:MAG: hypothetical protein WC764_00090 [Candidatus Paceibacterota bacterium]|jgi:cell division ATPase FtsA